MISNPNALAARIVRESDDEPTPPLFRIRNVLRATDWDKQYEDLIGVVESRFLDLDAKLLQPAPGGRLTPVHYPSLKAFLRSKPVQARIREALAQAKASPGELTDRILSAKSVPLKEVSSAFALGLYEDEISTPQTMFRLQDTVLPSTVSPYAKMQLWSDYLGAHQKAFEAATKNPLAKRIVDIIPQFVLGRGVVGGIKDTKRQADWDEFYRVNRMKLRIKQILRELLIYGEVFLRYFNTTTGLTIRSLDPSTIWDVVTNPDDIEEVKYYHQQYTIMNPYPVVGSTSATYAGTLIIRQIPADAIDHFKINSTSSEKRGRSQLFPILGWLLRFKEFMNDRVLLNKMRAMFAIDVAVDGTPEDVATTENQFSTPPGPGAVLVHNKSVEVEFKNASTDANEAKTDAEMILKVIAVGAGVSEQFLGVSAASTRAGALIQTEPDVKNFEAYQEIVEDILDRAERRVSKAKPSASGMEFTFPAIAQEDRSAKLKDIAFAEAMDYFAKERSAEMAAKEFGVTTYDFKQEQQTIQQERKGDPVIAQGLQQLPKVAPEPTEQPGLGGDLKPPKPGGEQSPALSHTSGEMGFSARKLSGRGTMNTQATLNRPEFTRGGEKTKLKTNRTTGTPLRHASSPDGSVIFTRRGWQESARQKSLIIRRLRALARKREEQLAKGLTEAVRQSEAAQTQLREALARMEAAKAPSVVNVTLPPPPEVRVEVAPAPAPNVTITPTPAPVVNVEVQAPPPARRHVRVERDPDTGLITSAETVEERVDGPSGKPPAGDAES